MEKHFSIGLLQYEVHQTNTFANVYQTFRILVLRPEVALGWDFLEIPNLPSPSEGFWMKIFHFGLD